MVEANESTDKQDEIDHIMQEIEQLQSEMGTAVQESVPAGHDATLADIHLPVEKEVEKEKESDFSKLSMNLQGKMTLQLNYAQEQIGRASCRERVSSPV